MTDASHILIDDGPVIDLFGNVMTGRTDEFHSTLVGPVLRFLSNKSGQKWVVDVDNPVWGKSPRTVA